ncbi:MAG: YaaR family protein [Halothermotrichaceae bacterium]
MRIDKNLSSNIKHKKTDSKTDKSTFVKKADFKEKLSEINHNKIKERLNRLLSIIDEQGKRLKKSLDKKDLLEYKKRVRDFLKIIHQEFSQAKQSFSWDQRGNMKTYTIIEKIDNKLEGLHDLFLEEQADALEVLKKVDEIRGLLLDLYI